jgi:trimeric autotransporter adhesin
MQAQVHDVSGQVVPDAAIFWSSKDTNIVTVSQAGVVTGESVGTTQIAASSNGQSAVVPVVVTPVGVASAAVAPSSAAITVGGTVVLQGIAYDASGNTLPGRTVVWASSAPQVATVDSKGKVTGVAAGTATITGTIEGRTASSVITVGVIPVAAVAVTPGSAAINVGQSAALTAVTTDANGNTLTGRTITWASANTAVATVSASGLVMGVGAGTTTIRATSEGKTGTAQVAVTAPAPTPPSVASVTVTPSSTTLATGGTATLTATVKQSDGTVLTGRTVTWSSSAPNVATVSNSGVVTAVAPGNATITATSEGKSGTASVTVSPPAVASVSVNPAALTLTNNHPKTLTATVYDAAQHEITGRTITWSSSDSSLAAVAKTGPTTATVTAVRHGIGVFITITAKCDGVSGTSVVTLAY